MNTYEIVSDKIIKQLENGVIPWHKPFNELRKGSFNRVTMKPYSLLNQLCLSKPGEYASLKQWSKLGGKIKKGSKAEQVVYWNFIKKEKKDKDGNIKKDKNGNPIMENIPVLKYFSVFHINDVEGVNPITNIDNKDVQNLEDADEIIFDYLLRENIHININKNNISKYIVDTDTIYIPEKSQYKSTEHYYNDMFVNCVKSTGINNRLNRTKVENESIISEIAASILMTELQIETKEVFDNSVSYINECINKIKENPKWIVSVVGKSEKAVKYILGE